VLLSEISPAKKLPTTPFDERCARNQANAVLQRLFNGETDKDWTRLEHPQLWGRYWTVVSDRSRRIAHSRKFKWFIIMVIVLVGILAGMSVDEKYKEDGAFQQANSSIGFIAFLIFCFELFVNVAAHRFRPSHFWFSHGHFNQPLYWSWFDTVIVVASALPQDVAAGGGDGLIIILRLMRLLLVFKMAKNLPKMRVAVDALLVGMVSIGWVGVLIVFICFFFAILGCMLFKSNDPWHFQNLHVSMVTLYRCATLEDWTDVMYINMYGCEKYGYRLMPERCVASEPWGYAALLYFFVFTVLGSLVLLNLFIGIVCLSMEEALRNLQKEQFTAKQIVSLKKRHNLSTKEFKLIENCFEVLDNDLSGAMSPDELREGLLAAKIGITEEQLRTVLKISDGFDGQITLDETGEILVSFVDFANFVCVIKKMREEDNIPIWSFVAAKKAAEHWMYLTFERERTMADVQDTLTSSIIFARKTMTVLGEDDNRTKEFGKRVSLLHLQRILHTEGDADAMAAVNMEIQHDLHEMTAGQLQLQLAECREKQQEDTATLHKIDTILRSRDAIPQMQSNTATALFAQSGLGLQEPTSARAVPATKDFDQTPQSCRSAPPHYRNLPPPGEDQDQPFFIDMNNEDYKNNEELHVEALRAVNAGHHVKIMI